MARAYASAIIEAPAETVWSILRDFNGLPVWHSAIATSKIEDGRDADSVGCVRSFHLSDGGHVRERLLALDDARRFMKYNFETPAFPVEHYVATLRVMPVTNLNRAFCEWEATFDEMTADKGYYAEIIANRVFAAGFASLADLIARTAPAPPADAMRWKAWSPNKVWTSAVIAAPVDQVWDRMRDFAGMGGWHDEIKGMHMINGVRPDKVSGIRDFFFGASRLNEELLHLDDTDRSFSYRITKCEMPWLNYVSGAQLWPITNTNETFGVWTGDWDASPHDDLTLIPATEGSVYQKAFATLQSLLGRSS